MYSVSGEQFVVGQHGFRFNFQGQPGKVYTLVGVGHIWITGRVLGVSDPDGTCFDKIVVKTAEHTVEVGCDGIRIDGKAPLEAHKQPGDWVWVDGNRVTVGAEDWIIGLLQDYGSSEVHQDGCLKDRRHVSLTMHKKFPDGAFGVMVEGYHGLDASFFEVQ